MSKTELKNTLAARPFEPFIAHTADGRAVPVPTIEHASLSPDGRVLHVWYDKGGSVRVEVMLITGLETVPRKTK